MCPTETDLERKLRDLEARASQLALENQALAERLSGALEDRVAERTRALQESERRLHRFQLLASRSRDAILFLRAGDGHILDANEAAVALYGYSLGELQAMTVADLRAAPEERPQVEEFLRRASQDGVLFESVQRRRDGTTVPVEVSAQAAEIDGERTIVSVNRDVSQRKAAEARLLLSEARFRAAFATSPDAINLTRLSDGVYVAVNEGFTRLTGWTEADVLGRSSLALNIWVDPADRARLVAGLRSHGRVENLEARFGFKDGRSLVGLMSAQILLLEGVEHILSVTRDITAMKQAEAERDALADRLRQSQKLEAMGRLAGGVAHDFNNLLTVILSSAATLKQDLASGRAPVVEDLDEIETAGQRARDLTRQLLAFARKQPLTAAALDLNQVVRSSERLLRRVLGEDVALQVALQPDLWPLVGDAGQLEQVILNLAVNARDAMPGGGVLAMMTSSWIGAEPSGESSPDGRLREYVRLMVRDSGVGMTPEVRARIFEPFFTTKPFGQGTGLGLATVYGIVKQMEGFIRVESAPGAGATFELCFPRAMGSAVATPPPALALRSGGHETVLLVEDDPLVRGVAVRALQGGGYRVLVAGGSAEALELLAGERRPLDLVVSDVVLPGVNGRALAEELRRRQPGLRVLLVSGYSRGLVDDSSKLDPGVEFLAKPFTPEVLLARVRALLDAR
jgi:PAS domain S-box-containing protein